MQNYEQLWNEVKEKVKNSNRIGSPEFEEAIEPITTIHKIINENIYLIVAHAFAKYRIDKFYLPLLNETLLEIAPNKMCFKLITKEDADKENKENLQKQPNQPDQKENVQVYRNLRPEYTFENFVTGESNRYAYISASKVAESPYVTMNPLYIFGEVGLGKTHLMMAVGHYMLEKNLNTNVVYTTAQQFAEDYFNATSNIKKNPESMSNFNNYYRSADLLLVDDVQLLANKTSTQEEFFKLFEFLFEKNKQIIITSDRTANELENIMARLKSRFTWGEQVDIRKPDLEHRKTILKRKLGFLIPNPGLVDDSIIQFIAEKFDNNVRELEGALRRFVNYCVSFNIPFSLDNAKLSLDSIIQVDKKEESNDRFEQIDRVKRAISKYYSISITDLAATTRKKEIVLPRQIAIYLIRTTYDIPLKKIGEYFGNRDHATVAHAFDKISSLIKDDWTVKQDVDNITKML